MALRIAGFLRDSPQSFAPHLREKYISLYAVVIIHGLCGCVALALGAIQFIELFRRHRPRLHRFIGTIYLGCVAVSGVLGLRMALSAYGGNMAKVGFTCLAVLWLYSGSRALTSALRGDIKSHRRWMIRNYAFTFSAVMVRVWLSISYQLELPMEMSYIVIAWISWLPTVLLAELINLKTAVNGAGREQERSVA